MLAYLIYFCMKNTLNFPVSYFLFGCLFDVSQEQYDKIRQILKVCREKFTWKLILI